ncbi:hypothetical protein MN116_007780 [Schistosoma mekongi]|uniref:Ig-like domain-containing protein n=1 Tax=Schistosoma mekongi TaxID=38744 RepID=A0AAE1Z770_SCHME|nr:hypothetical protein MN116_007780 [Schistosoma mekongi]
MSLNDRSFNNISYLSNSLLEDKWNTYLNRVNNQYFSQDSINHISNSNNQSYYTSLFPNSLDTSLPSAAPSLSLSSAEAATTTSFDRVYNPKITHPYLAGESQTEQILKYILSNYKSHERPNENSPDPTIVSVFIHIIDISSSNVVQMEYTINCYLRQQWHDPRLAWEINTQLSSTSSSTTTTTTTTTVIRELLLNQQIKQLWLPDLFFRNGKSGFLHDMSQPNYLLRVKSNGQVLYSQKITMTLSCQMYLRKFPMDKQECTVNIGSYGYTIDQLKFIWHHDKPVTISDNLQLLEFESPHGAYTLDCTKNGTTNTGTYSCLLLVIPLRRLIGSYIVTTYIPEILIVMVSWLGFWIDIKAVPARVTLGLLTLLGLLTESSSVSSQLPKVTYLKAIDVWLTVCLLFVIAALAEFAYAYLMAPKNEGPEWEPEVRELVKVLLTTYAGEVRCCCCFTKNRHHKPIIETTSQQRSQSHQPQSSQDSNIKRTNLHTRGTESDPESTIKSSKNKLTRTGRTKHIQSTNKHCKVCDTYQPVCCTCPTCSRLKCPEAPRKKQTLVKISTKHSKLEPVKLVNSNNNNNEESKNHEMVTYTLVDYPKTIKPIKRTRPIRRKHTQPLKTTDSCRVLIEPLCKELMLLDRQPKKSALKVRIPPKCDESTSAKELKTTTFLDDEKPMKSLTHINHNHQQQHHPLNQPNDKLWYLKHLCLCIKHNSDHHHHHHNQQHQHQKQQQQQQPSQQIKKESYPSKKFNSIKVNLPYESKIDAYSRLIFPILFFIFMCIYWFFYLVIAKD